MSKLRKDHEGERERVKKAISDMKKKMDRCIRRRKSLRGNCPI